VTAHRRSRIRPLVVTSVLGVLGALMLLFALGRPSVGRFLAAGLLLGAAAVVRHHEVHRDDPERNGRAAQLHSLYWSVVIAVVFVGASFLISALLSG
jgi:hypothetical protein